MFTDIGDLFKLSLARRVGLFGGKTPRLVGMAPGKGDQRIGTDIHRLILLILVVCPGVVEEVKGLALLGDSPLEVQHAVMIDLVVQNRMARRTLFHELGKDARIVGLLPVGAHRGKELFPLGLAPPERDDLVGIDLHRLITDLKRCAFAAVEDSQVFYCMTAKLRICGCRLGRPAPLADNQFAVADVYLLVGHEVFKRSRPKHHR